MSKTNPRGDRARRRHDDSFNRVPDYQELKMIGFHLRICIEPKRRREPKRIRQICAQ